MARILIFTGKGGVGKSMGSSAHARKSALEGKKIVIKRKSYPNGGILLMG